MNKSKVLFIATFPPPIHGSSVVSQQIKDSKLINETFDCYYVNISSSRKMNEVGNNSFFLLIVKFVRLLKSLIRTLYLLLFHRFDLCYCAITINGICFLRDAPYVLLCKLFHYKVVIHQHNKGVANYCNKPLYRSLYRWVYHKTKVILLSRYLYQDIESFVDERDVMICPNGIKPSIALSHRKRNSNSPHILFLSNLIESKGCLILLDACKILRDNGLMFSCDVIGGETSEISSERFLKEIHNRALNDTVIYHGRKYGDEKDRYWAEAEIFAFPTFYFNECFPLVLLEAMEKGIACVSTIEGGIRDIIDEGKTGYVVQKKDPESLANVLKKLLQNPELRYNMGAEGRKKFEQYYTEEQFEHKILECLKLSM